MDRWVHLFFFHLTPVTGIRRGVVGRVCQPSRYMECIWSSTAGSRLLSVGMSPLPSAVPVSVYGRPGRVAWRNAALPWMSGVQTGWQVEHLRTIVSCSNAFQEPLWHPCTYSLSLWLLLTNQLFSRCSRSGLKVAIKILIWVRKEDPSGNSAENHMHWEKNDCRVAKYIISEPRLKKKSVKRWRDSLVYMTGGFLWLVAQQMWGSSFSVWFQFLFFPILTVSGH